MITGLLSTLATGVKLPLTSTLNLYLVNDSANSACRIQGSQDFPIGDYDLAMLFWRAYCVGSEFDAGVTVYLFQTGGGNFTFTPESRRRPGPGPDRPNDAPLVNSNGFRIGGVRLYSFFYGGILQRIQL